ncbi:MAG: ribbon-helix-helix domain-containing protein [Candidatus Sedimenticola sp. (ex Thyasira tokunagai)]
MTTVYLEEQQLDDLKLLHKVTRVPMAEYLREGVDLVLNKYADDLKKGKK